MYRPVVVEVGEHPALSRKARREVVFGRGGRAAGGVGCRQRNAQVVAMDPAQLDGAHAVGRRHRQRGIAAGAVTAAERAGSRRGQGRSPPWSSCRQLPMPWSLRRRCGICARHRMNSQIAAEAAVPVFAQRPRPARRAGRPGRVCQGSSGGEGWPRRRNRAMAALGKLVRELLPAI